jgi:CubicO group peptidase (beta-lactamase class C family)
MTSVAAMQCVERGLLKLDEDLAKNILPEFQGIQVLSSIDENGPVFKPATRKITLRNLLTHSSGVAYEFTHPKILAWRSWFNKQSAENKAKSRSTDAAVGYLVPLVFEPDQGWVYGYGIDWAGVAVSRVSGLSLAEFMDQNIWQPLGMKSTTFDLEARPDLLARLSSMAERDGEGKLQRGKRDLMGAPGTVVVKESGGGGACSTANDYIKLLISLLKNDERLVRKETVDLMFSPSLADPSHLMEVHANPLAYGLAGNIPIGTKVDFGLGGILNLEEVKPTGRASGGMQWGGLPNLFWWINREHGICGCYFGQLLPAGDVPSFEMYERFEAAVNESFKQEKGKL